MKRPFLSLSFAVLMTLSIGPACAPPSGDPGGPTDPVCGNGIVEDGEDCDDGNNIAGDGCRADCTVEECGDGIRDPGEQCDDGNTQPGDGCDANCKVEGPSTAEQIDDYIRGLGHVPFDPAGSAPEPAGTLQGAAPYYACTTSNSKDTVQFNELSALVTDQSFLFPGAILDGNSLGDSAFTPVGLARKPLNYSLDILDGSGKSFVATMQNPSKSDFLSTFGPQLKDVNLSKIPTAGDITFTEVTNEDDLSLALGVNVKTSTLQANGSFDFTDTKKRSHFLVEIDESFFTAFADDPANPSDFLANSVTLDEVKQKFAAGDPPAYISSITYGQRIYLLIDSAFDSAETKAALDATFKGAVTQVDANASFDSKQVFNSLTIHATTVGTVSSQTSALLAAVVGQSSAQDPFTAIQKLLATGEEFTVDSPGAPIAFTVRHLGDDSTATVSFTADVAVQNCVRIGEDIQVALDSIKVTNPKDGLGDTTLEIFGTVSATPINGNASNPSVDIFDFSRDQAVSITADQGNQNGGFLGNTAQNTKVVRLNLQGTKPALDLSATLFERDGGTADDPIPPVSVQYFLPQDNDKLNSSQSIDLPSTSGDLTVNVTLTPVQNN